MKLRVLTLPLFVLFLSLLPLTWTHAQSNVVPGRSVGHVFLGMDRADVWKILYKPNKSYTVPHGMNLYSEDIWSRRGFELSVISEHDKVIQVIFNSSRFTTTDGLSTPSTLARVRRHHPSMSVRAYALRYATDHFTHITYYLDDIQAGIAFSVYEYGVIEPDILSTSLDRLVIHQPGSPTVPIFDGHWAASVSSGTDPDIIRRLRASFMLGGTYSQAH